MMTRFGTLHKRDSCPGPQTHQLCPDPQSIGLIPSDHGEFRLGRIGQIWRLAVRRGLIVEGGDRLQGRSDADLSFFILDGRQPPDLTADKLLVHSRLPLA
jgi:hypothetical protein